MKNVFSNEAKNWTRMSMLQDCFYILAIHNIAREVLNVSTIDGIYYSLSYSLKTDSLC